MIGLGSDKNVLVNDNRLIKGKRQISPLFQQILNQKKFSLLPSFLKDGPNPNTSGVRVHLNRKGWIVISPIAHQVQRQGFQYLGETISVPVFFRLAVNNQWQLHKFRFVRQLHELVENKQQIPVFVIAKCDLQWSVLVNIRISSRVNPEENWTYKKSVIIQDNTVTILFIAMRVSILWN